MPIPWLGIIDAVIGVTALARSRKSPEMSEPQQLETGGRNLGGLETRLASVVVAALKEAFDRDTRRLELEREQLATERERLERALRLELQRQAGDREIGRLRLLAGVAVVSWLGTLLLASRLVSASSGARLALGGGWLLLLAAIAASFSAQARVAGALTRVDDGGARGAVITSGASGALALWLSVFGLALVALAVLIA
jgi:hypothetical protein